MVDDNQLLASDWISFNSDKGRFVVYDLRHHTSTAYSFEEGAGPADIYYDRASGTIYIPQMPKNRVVIENLNNLKKG
jgi:hypothetical protein